METFTKHPRGCPAQDEFGLVLSGAIERLSGQCVYGSQASISWLFGALSIICWFQAQFPQLIMNLQRSSTEGVSAAFLANWMIGDVTNLVGCVLTRQLPFQTLLATYYCFIDACLVFQYMLYNFVRRPSVVVLEGMERNEHQPIRRATWTSKLNSVLVIAMLVSGVAADSGTSSSTIAIGTISAWSSSLLYFTSRLPQMYALNKISLLVPTNESSHKNYTRKSTEGLSVLLFLAAFCGNLFYTLSILGSPLAWPSEYTTTDEARTFLLNALPFLIGSAGTLCFDVCIISQWMHYRSSEKPLFNVQFSFRRVRRRKSDGIVEAEALLRHSMREYGIRSEVAAEE